MLDLQLSYSNFCALQFKFLEKNPGQSRQAELVSTLALQSGAHAGVRASTAPRLRWARTLRPASVRRSARRGTTPLAPHRLPPPLPLRHAPRAPWLSVPTLPPPATGVSVVPAPRRCHNRAHAATWPTRWRARTALQATTAFKKQ
jgi:hypothetical protein